MDLIGLIWFKAYKTVDSFQVFTKNFFYEFDFAMKMVSSGTVSKVANASKDVVRNVLDTVETVAKNVDLPTLPDLGSVIDHGSNLIDTESRSRIRQTAKAIAKGIGRHMDRLGGGFGKGLASVGNGLLGGLVPVATPAPPPASIINWPETFMVMAVLLVLLFGGFLFFLVRERRRVMRSRREYSRQREMELCRRVYSDEATSPPAYTPQLTSTSTGDRHLSKNASEALLDCATRYPKPAMRRPSTKV
ncbi:unnamed protein product [Oikopleura dioica]|uniref:Uncharacterized protein n=1 Tax=Oikopleura dioica TaxID=34765 RepID=E4WYB3_OIKDI|nr:unnamed protein product [Oikopleura dioica]